VTGPAVKFCGLTRLEDAAEAAQLDAGYLGAIFAGGPRLLSADRAAALFAAGRAAAALAGRRLPLCVGVMGSQSPHAIAALAADATLDVVQLHADPVAADVEAVRRVAGVRVWAVLRVAGHVLPPTAAELFAAADAVVLDAKVDGRLGGTGVALDWEALAQACDAVRGDTPLVLAGGLTPGNVALAASALAPDVVDVSSGVERAPGVKDHRLMHAFAVAAASARRPAPAEHPS